jgi:uncharacterized protein YjgD (DUF1641 family)
MQNEDEYRKLSDELSIKRVVRADSLAEALRLAEWLKRHGHFDLFRGQANAAWQLIPSGHRDATREVLEERNKRIETFLDFAVTTPGMSQYLDNLDLKQA